MAGPDPGVSLSRPPGAGRGGGLERPYLGPDDEPRHRSPARPRQDV